MILKRLAGVFFGIAFLMAIVLFGGIGRDYISVQTARYIFIGCGAVAFLLNLVSFQSGKHSPSFNLLYWSGTIITFGGLIFIMMHWPKAYLVLTVGIMVIGASFIMPFSPKEDPTDNQDLLDN